MEQYDSLAKGLDRISDIICRFTVIERLYRQPDVRTLSADMAASFEVNATKLYSQVLKYQAQVVCRSPLAVVQIGRDMLRLDEWDKLLGDILSAEEECLRQTGVIDSAMLHKAFEDMHVHQNELLKAFESQRENLETLQKKQDQTLEEVKAVRSEQKEWHASDEESECLRSLYAWTPVSGLDYESDKDLNPRPIPGTCKWFLEDSRYKTWLDAKGSSILWVSAGPGCGKSVLSKLLVDRFQSVYAQESHTICYFFFKDISDRRRSIACALRAILHQLFTNKTSLLGHAMDDFKNKGSSSTTDFSILWKIFTKAAADPNCSEIICVVDALDESEQLRHGGLDGQAMLIGKLTELYSGSGIYDTAPMKLKFIVTSRPYLKIERMFYELTSKLPTVRFDGDEETKNIRADIDLVIEHRIKRMLWLKEHVKTALVNRLTGTENRTYLWVHLIFPSIERSTETTEVELLKVISTLPRTVEEAYEEILKQSSDREKARKLLHIVIAANRSLTIAEMNVAMVVADGAKSEEDLKLRLDQEDDFRTKVTNLCGLFVRVIGQNIYLVHQTAKEFLEAPLEPSTHVVSSSDKWKHSLEPRESNLTIAKICISYLQFALDSHPLLIDDGADYWEVRKEINRYLKDHHFLDYAAKNWVAHFRGAGSEFAVLDSIMTVCDTQSQRFRTWFQVYWTTQYSLCPQQLTDIMVGSYFGLEVMVQRLLMRAVELDPRDDGGRTPLSWATGNGHVAVVQLLIKQDSLELNSKDHNGRTPLSWASVAGEEAVVRLLLQRGANIQIKDEKNLSALHWAVEYGHEGTIRLLLGRADDIAVGDDREPRLLYSTADVGYESLMRQLLKEGVDLTLFRTVESGNRRAVRLLADAGANIEAKCLGKHTALLEAVLRGHEEVVSLLLQNGADIKAKDSDGKTVLHLAANSVRNRGLIQLLLDNGADAKVKDTYGQTALHTAARSGNEVAAGLLVGLQDVNINESDNYGQTPLRLGAATGSEGIVQLLLKQDDVDLKSKDSGGDTVLLAAIGGEVVEENEHGTTFRRGQNVRMRGTVMQLLLERNDVEPNAINSIGRTALLQAASDGDANMVRLLLERDDINLNATDNSGWTALTSAAFWGKTEVVRVLLERGGVKQDVTDNEGRTALIHAARRGDEEMVRLLLPKAVKGVEGETALREAAWNGKEAIVHLLLDHMYEGSNVDEKSRSEHWLATAQLPRAIESGDEAAVQMLIENGADLQANPRSEQTALMSAAERGYDKITRLLLDNGANIEASESGRTALHLAAGAGHLSVVKLLVENGAAIDKDSASGTALSLAAKGGHEAVVRLLLDKRASMESEEWTALHWAAWHGYKEMVQLLVENGADVEAKSPPEGPEGGTESPHDGSTALCLAAWKCHNERSQRHLEIVRLLAQSGADATAARCDGSTALHLMALEGHNTLVRLLMEKGAKIDVQDSKGRTALQNAAERGHEATVRLLLELGAKPIDVGGIQRSQAVTREDFKAAVEVIKKWPGVPSLEV
ncbi:uncharacterized protein PAC_03377 [Phialocephala subalpina]|uniref:Nephrocystin 3-like N-terminal domain-containing protein n=1 Tax=Phialocephala subalpina TaxID=576137 RepID=A0A1L7WL55_9HELO|nr:uncharacterized protein PAC_03377 [Phialocephala subalpina]